MIALRLAAVSLSIAMGMLVPSQSRALTTVYTATLAPVGGGATGSGSAQVDWDDVAHTMRVQAAFSGLSGLTSASHIHAPASGGGSEIATQAPSFLGFPLGVQAGSYDMTFDTTLPTTYNPQYIVDWGGTTAGAEAALKAALDGGTAYFNIHTSNFPNGEIQGFLTAVPEPATGALVALGFAGIAIAARRRR